MTKALLTTSQRRQSWNVLYSLKVMVNCIFNSFFFNNVKDRVGYWQYDNKEKKKDIIIKQDSKVFFIHFMIYISRIFSKVSKTYLLFILSSLVIDIRYFLSHLSKKYRENSWKNYSNTTKIENFKSNNLQYCKSRRYIFLQILLIVF